MSESRDSNPQAQPPPMLQYGHVERRKPSYYVRVFIGVTMLFLGVIFLLAIIADVRGGYGWNPLILGFCMLMLGLGPLLVLKK